MPSPISRRRTATPLLLAGVALTSFSDCGSLTVAPMADIDLSPALLCEGSESQTVTLSAKRSQNAEGTSEGLAFVWQTRPSPRAILHGGLHESEWVAEFSGRSPLTVELKVTDGAGETATRSRVLPLTRTTATPCTAGCLSHELCAAVGGEERCVEAELCGGDDECGCLHCGTVDDGSRHCLAR